MPDGETLTNKQWRHLDTGQTWYTFSCDEYWVCCIHCGRAGMVKNGRFACRHCSLVLQNDDEHCYWFGECELYAFGRCYHCGVKYNICEHYPKVLGNVRSVYQTKRFDCQTCKKENTVELDIYKKSGYGEDNYFGMPLLLQAEFKGELFWAYNDKHLAELKRFIGATLRERNHLAGNRSMASRLPFWIKSAKNRDKLLVLIEKLENSEKPI